jgi:hypothetical protein
MSKSLEQRIQVLEDQHALAELKATYVNFNDGGWKGPTHANPQAVAGLFTEDGTWDGRPSAGYARGRAEIQQLFEAFGAVRFILHYITNPMITIDGDEATGHWHALVAMTTPADQAMWIMGLYIDKFARTPEGWKFKSLRFETAAATAYELGWAKQRMLFAEDPFERDTF